MANTTANYGFTKPDKGAAGWDVDLNKNFDDIDTQIKARADESAARYTKTETDNTFATKATIGDLAVLSTTAKDSIVNALNEVFNEVNDGKTSIYGAIVDKGVTPSSQAFADLVTAIGAITTGGDVTIEGTATASDILEGKTATTKNGLVTGTMANNPLNTNASDIIVESNLLHLFIPFGAYLEPSATHADKTAVQVPAPTLIPANIKAGASIFGITGKSSVVDTADATAVAEDIASGKTAYVNGAKITGALAVQATAAQTITPGTTDVVKPAGIYDGAITIKGDVNLVASNIRKDISLFGIVGTLEEGGHYWEGTVTSSATDYGYPYFTQLDGSSSSRFSYLNLTGLVSFNPKLIFAINSSTLSIYSSKSNSYWSDGATYLFEYYPYSSDESTEQCPLRANTSSSDEISAGKIILPVYGASKSYTVVAMG